MSNSNSSAANEAGRLRLLELNVKKLQGQIQALSRNTPEFKIDMVVKAVWERLGYRDEDRVATVEATSRVRVLSEAVRDLRQLVMQLMREGGLRPVEMQGDTWWRDDRDVLKPEHNAHLNTGEAGDALGLLVRARLKGLLSAKGSTLLTENNIDRRLRSVLERKMDWVIQDIIGIDERGRVGHNSPLRKLLEKKLSDRLDTLVAEAVEHAVSDTDWADLLPDLNDEVAERAIALYARLVREGVENEVRKRANATLGEALDQAISDSVLEAMPWLRKYQAVRRLGHEVTVADVRRGLTEPSEEAG